MGDDHITFSGGDYTNEFHLDLTMNKDPNRYKYSEDSDSQRTATDYISGTYNQHYSAGD